VNQRQFQLSDPSGQHNALGLLLFFIWVDPLLEYFDQVNDEFTLLVLTEELHADTFKPLVTNCVEFSGFNVTACLEFLVCVDTSYLGVLEGISGLFQGFFYHSLV
jgi:hypothetical protein